LVLFLFFLFVQSLTAQDDLMKILDETQPKAKEFAIATFKSTRLVNMHTTEVLGKRSLDFRISHRFGDINSGANNAWGLDGPANIKLSLEYSYDGRLMAGIGRSSYQKMVDGFLKYRLIRQTTDNRNPLSITLFSGIYETLTDLSSGSPADNKYADISNRLSYVSELLIARKFNSNFSLQIAPIYVHYNLVDFASDKNDVYAIAFVTRIKYTKRQAVTLEYVWRLNKYSQTTYYDSMGIGWELETGGHVFSVHLTNSFGISENQFVAYTSNTWENVGIRLGFNISRVFTI